MLYDDVAHDSARQEQVQHAASFLHSHVKELESTIVAQRMALEQSRQREMSLHKTIEGFGQMVVVKDKKIEELDAVVKKLEAALCSVQDSARALGSELSELRRQRVVKLSSPSPRAVLDDSSASQNEPAVNPDGLLIENARLRAESEEKTKQLNECLGVIDSMLSAARYSGGGAVAELEKRMVSLLQQLHCVRNPRETAPSPIRTSPPRVHSSPRFVAERMSTGSPSAFHSHRTSVALMPESVLKQTSVQLLHRENLDLRMRLEGLDTPVGTQTSQ
jgi:uncharacterized coiled-coil protein SlyX